MGDINDKARRSLAAMDAAAPLVQLMSTILDDFPDPYALAGKHAARLLLKHTGRAMDPRFV